MAEVLPLKRPNPDLVQQCLTNVAEKAAKDFVLKRRKTDGCAICFKDLGVGKHITACVKCKTKWHTDCATIFRDLKCVNCGRIEFEEDSDVKYFKCQICGEDIATSGGYESFIQSHFQKCLQVKTLAEI